ncbi:MAG: hypothetical protein EXR03_01870 [Pseudolabrys sp.]|nr:hypothetical protein [Pseudolabrys sp.]MSP31555.1 hypothetical protein [Pseudolabrys sp.]
MADQIRYDLLTQQALRGVVRGVLTDAAKKGLPGDHHFFITFDTHADGVRMSDQLRAQYPDEMTVILQHQFWDLKVDEHGFEVGLSFGGITERLAIPFEAINGFFDPSVQFGLQFEEVVEGQGRQTPANAQEKGQEKGQDKGHDKPAKKKRFPGPTLAETKAPGPPALAAVPDPEPDKPKSGGGEVVRLDRFRKK